MHRQTESVGGVYGNDATAEQVQTAFENGTHPVAVYGLGKMGLPLAAVFADVCGAVIGVDIDPAVVESVNAGNCHVQREPGLPDLVADCVAAGELRATSDPAAAAAAATVHVVIVPTPLTDTSEPDLSMLDAAIDGIAEGVAPGDLVLVECTVPPRTTADRVRPGIAAAAGLETDAFGVAFCPERTASGRAIQDIRGAYPKVVGGVDDESTRLAECIYASINDSGVIAVADATTAECVKLFEGLYRDVNIALANELATFTDELDVDVRAAIEAANTQPFCDIHDPGPGVGGHCIPVYPHFLIEPFDTEAPLLETAREVNDSMPVFTVETLREELAADGVELAAASVLVLGLTYRPGVEETQTSPARPIAERLSAAGADVDGIDPLLDDTAEFDLEQLPLSRASERDYDAIVMVTPHDEFGALDWDSIGRPAGSVVIDGRDTLTLSDTSHRVYTVGRGPVE
ncbi:nucleotide sugar dehydrogenase [Haloarcula hispanica]|uniref:UDP-N-acetyl-D-mannosamine dehydrogenase n=1 Tax=Haloarcula hispanica TaxID=51589 RepID=A0A482T7M5_HALHI|nr:nucleotide sugar dehydrogenase [Haloarcula hispanica]MCJ0620722.1 nucleotide sugar dehydrogenase [Haloarcula hispanica]RYJ11090.1 nucleotide sugar dehydrogenase [Haloarcula hispanica]